MTQLELAEIFGVSVDELIQVKSSTKENKDHAGIAEIVQLALKGVALAMGIAVVVLSFMEKLRWILQPVCWGWALHASRLHSFLKRKNRYMIEK